MSTDLRTLLDSWREAKDEEEAAKARRRDLEDELAAHLRPLPAGTAEHEVAGHRVTITGRAGYEVNTAMLRALARDHGVEAELDGLFRWTAEVRVGEWKRADPALTAILAPAVTLKVSRPFWAIIEQADAAGAADATNNGGAKGAPDKE